MKVKHTHFISMKFFYLLLLGLILYYFIGCEGFPECSDVSEVTVENAIKRYVTKQELDTFFDINKPDKRALSSNNTDSIAAYEEALNQLWIQVDIKRDSLVKANRFKLGDIAEIGLDDIGMPPNQTLICECRAKYRYKGKSQFFRFNLVNKNNKVSYRTVTGRYN
jgi:hypothetical protein